MSTPLAIFSLPGWGFVVGIVCFFVGGGADRTAWSDESLPTPVDFNRDIRPILSDACFQCHGPDESQRASDLRLDLKERAFAEIDGRRAVVGGDVAASELWRRITAADPDMHMPPPDRVRQLSEREVSLLRRWIEEGAAWQEHWSFVAPVRPLLPLRRARHREQNAIDAFVQARLENEGLSLSPPASREAQLRRVTLDLTGLPPTLEEVEAFLSDDAPDAYERVVDRLLASPRLGERLALMWLDAARYADTSGYQTDGERHMWRWRDWVIDAFNRNQPFDAFTVEQIAGDLLPHPTVDQVVATGFNRNHRANSEGGIVFEEYLAEYAADRVDTTATVWLGLTAGCARCHDHKYDPLRQEEFYRLVAYFNRLPELGRVFKFGNSPPWVKAPTAAMEEELRRLDRQLEAARSAVESHQTDLEAAQQIWERQLHGGDAAATAIANGWEGVEDSLAAWFPLDGDGGDARADGALGVLEGAPRFVEGRLDQCVELADGQFLAVELSLPLTDTAPFSLAAWVAPRDLHDATIVSLMNDKDTRDGGLSLHFRDGRLQLNMGPRWLDDALRVETERRFAPGSWLHVAATYDASRQASGLKLYVNGEPQPLRVGVDLLTGGLTTPTLVRIGSRGFEGHWAGKIDDVRIYRRSLRPSEVAVLSCLDSPAAIAAIPREKRTPQQFEKLRAYFLANDAPEAIRSAAAHLRAVEDARRRFWDSLPTVMVMQDAAPRDTFVLVRGEYDKPGQRVAAGVPAFLPPLPATAPDNRLALAQWLVNPQNPLPARVTVNRLWALFFGEGLMRTLEDFGAQGDRPSHPELLDWLAVEFVESGWDVKALLRTIVTSATYRQSSQVTPLLLEKDPGNRLLARAPRLRLSAEAARDQALAASGLLHGPIGGPSVKPYQPPGLWEELASQTYQPDRGANLYRRSLYTFWKRTVPPPGMTAFDAPSRESCTVRRSRTNTPLQALALMNERIYVEAANELARRMIDEGGATPEERLSYGFRRVLGRTPTSQEQETLRANWERCRQRLQANPEAARRFVAEHLSEPSHTFETIDLAAYALAAGLIFNLDETITRE